MKDIRLELDPKANVATRDIDNHLSKRERAPDAFAKERYVFRCPVIKGLELRVSNNSAAWSLLYNIKSGERWLKRRVQLGSYPLITVGAARKEGGAIKTKVAQGGDPSAEKKEAAAKRQAELDKAFSVNDLFALWIQSAKMRNRKTGTAEPSRMMNKDVLPRIGRLDVSEVGSRHLVALRDSLELRGARITNITMALVRQMFGFAADRFLIQEIPRFPAKLEENPPCERVLNVAEVLELFNKMDPSGLVNTTQLALKLQLATACRIGELINAQWRHVDFDAQEWLIPAENSKTGAALTVYLSEYAASLFRQMYDLSGYLDWVLPNRAGDGPLTEKSITKQVKDRQREHQIAGRTQLHDALVLSSGMWTPHDLRRTAATLMRDLHVNPFVVEKCLNHAAEKMARTYTPTDPELEMYNAWQTLGELLAVIDSDKGAELGAMVIANQKQPIRNRRPLADLLRKVKATEVLRFPVPKQA